jgi:hypothetical protein
MNNMGGRVVGGDVDDDDDIFLVVPINVRLLFL